MISMPHNLAEDDIELYFKLAVAAIFVIGWAVKSVSNLAKPKAPPRSPPPLPPPMPMSSRGLGAGRTPVRPPLARVIPPMRQPASPFAGPGQIARPPALPQRLPLPPVRRVGPPPIPGRPGGMGAPMAQPAASVILPALAALAQPRPKKRKKVAKPATLSAPQGLSAPLSAESVQAILGTGKVDSRLRVASWINAGTVRSEFLLAEALRPPLALRESHR